MSVLPGIALVLVIMIVAGGIAYIGDRVGHQVGRKRLTLFGLRPKHTSTVVAVATGMLIAFSVTVLAIAASGYVRTAFFRIGQLSAQINQLQAQALSEQDELKITRDSNIVLSRESLVAPFGRVIDVTLPEAAQVRELTALFNETVGYANATYTNARFGLLPDVNRAGDATIQSGLLTVLRAAREHAADMGDGNVPLFFLPVAPQNLFRGERVTFTFDAWPDVKLVDANEALASIDVDGGKPVSDLAYQTLLAKTMDQLARLRFPAPFIVSPASGFDPARTQQATAQLAKLRGRFRLVARSETDLYPHSGQYVLSLSVEPA